MTEAFEEIADRLYELPPAKFVSARDEAVATARAAGDRGHARAIAALRRPTVAAWLVNLLVRHRAELVGDLLNLGTALRSAQHELHGPRLRELAGRRRAVIAELVGQAGDLAIAAGMARIGLPTGEVEATLTAALADADVARDVRSGRLLRAVHYDGFGEISRPRLEVLPGGKANDAEPAPEEKEEPPRPARERRRNIDPEQDDRRRTEARAALVTAEQVLGEADDLTRGRSEALADIEVRLTDLRRDRVTARMELAEANTRRDAAERAVATARQALKTAERR